MSSDRHSITYAYQELDRLTLHMRTTIEIHAHEVMLAQQFIASLNRPVNGWTVDYASVGFSPGSLQGVIIQFFLRLDETFKVVEPIIQFLLNRGWVPSASSEDADFGYREFAYTKKATEPPLFWPQHHEWKPKDMTATLRVWPHKESVTCKKVQVGVKPEYKFECAQS